MENKILKWSVILGIVIVLNLFFAYAMKVVYKAPQWNQFCQEKQVIDKIVTKTSCLEKGGQWNENIINIPVQNSEGLYIPEKTERGYCNQNFVCQNKFQKSREEYEKNVFMTLIALGVISIIISFLIASEVIVSIGLSLGGILSFVVASMRYWRYAGEYLQVIILGLALAVLIWLGIKKFK